MSLKVETLEHHSVTSVSPRTEVYVCFYTLQKTCLETVIKKILYKILIERDILIILIYFEIYEKLYNKFHLDNLDKPNYQGFVLSGLFVWNSFVNIMEITVYLKWF